MPVALVVVLLDITLIYHASRTGRLQPWAFIILMIPVVGALAYIVVELVPEWFGSPGAQQARKRIAGKLDPEKRYRELSDRLAGSDTIANRDALAAECLKIGRFDEAERHFDHILNLPMGSEPAYALGKAQAEFGRNRPADALAELEDLKALARFSIGRGPSALCPLIGRGRTHRRGARRIPRGRSLFSRRGGAGPIRHAAAHGGPQRRGAGWCSTNCCCR